MELLAQFSCNSNESLYTKSYKNQNFCNIFDSCTFVLILFSPTDPIHPDENPQNSIVAPSPIKPRAMTISTNSTDHTPAKIAPPPEWGKPRPKFGAGICALRWLFINKKKITKLSFWLQYSAKCNFLLFEPYQVFEKAIWYICSCELFSYPLPHQNSFIWPLQSRTMPSVSTLKEISQILGNPDRFRVIFGKWNDSRKWNNSRKFQKIC